FLIHQSLLLPELALVAAAAQPGSPIRALSQVRLEARDSGALQLVAHNLEYGIASELPAQVTEPGVIFLPAAKLLSLINALDGEVALHTAANNSATITACRSRSRMPGEAAMDTFTELPMMPEARVDVPAEMLAENLTRVEPMVARVTGRFEVAAALITSTGDQLIFVGTDGRRLALARVPITSGPFEFLFPLGAMACVHKLLDGVEQACIAANKEHLFVAAGFRLLAARQIAGKFPDYERVLPNF